MTNSFKEYYYNEGYEKGFREAFLNRLHYDYEFTQKCDKLLDEYKVEEAYKKGRWEGFSEGKDFGYKRYKEGLI